MTTSAPIAFQIDSRRISPAISRAMAWPPAKRIRGIGVSSPAAAWARVRSRWIVSRRAKRARPKSVSNGGRFGRASSRRLRPSVET